MKRLIVVGLMLAALFRGAGAAEGKFSSSVTPEDLAAAGLAGITPAQRARLDALVEAYKSGALATARRAASDALAGKQAAEAQAARAEAKAETARIAAAKAEAARLETAKAEAARTEAARVRAEAAKAESAKSAPSAGFLAKTKSLLKPSAQAEVVVVESSIPGKFRGWESRQIFTLANGQRWQVGRNESYYHPVIENPKVQIVPATLAGHWMRFPDLGAEVRVTFLGEN